MKPVLHPAFDAIVPAWDALAERVDASPFARAGWFAAWMDAFGSGRPEVLGLWEDDALRAVLPLERTRSGLRAPTNWHTPLFPLLADSPSARTELLAALFAHEALAVELAFLDDDAFDAGVATGAACFTGRRTLARTTVRPPYIDLRHDFGAYEAGLSRNRRKGLQRRRRRLEELGPVTVEVADGREDLEACLDEVLAVEASGWKGRAGTAIASSEATIGFYGAIARWAAECGWLRLSALRVGERAIAVDLALVHGGHWYSLKTGYDERLRALAPGVELLHRLVERAYGEGLGRFELLGDQDPFKLEWATGQRELLELQTFRPTAAGAVAHAVAGARVTARPAVNGLRRVGTGVSAAGTRAAVQLHKIDGVPQVLTTL